MVYLLLSIITCALKLKLCYIYYYRKREKKANGEDEEESKNFCKIIIIFHIIMYNFHNQKIYISKYIYV